MDLQVDTNVSEERTNSIFRARKCVPPKSWYLPTSPHGVITQKTNIDRLKTKNVLYVSHIMLQNLWLIFPFMGAAVAFSS
jgi:hypothetical protein